MVKSGDFIVLLDLKAVEGRLKVARQRLTEAGGSRCRPTDQVEGNEGRAGFNVLG